MLHQIVGRGGRLAFITSNPRCAVRPGAQTLACPIVIDELMHNRFDLVADFEHWFSNTFFVVLGPPDMLDVMIRANTTLGRVASPIFRTNNFPRCSSSRRWGSVQESSANALTSMSTGTVDADCSPMQPLSKEQRQSRSIADRDRVQAHAHDGKVRQTVEAIREQHHDQCSRIIHPLKILRQKRSG